MRFVLVSVAFLLLQLQQSNSNANRCLYGLPLSDTTIKALCKEAATGTAMATRLSQIPLYNSALAAIKKARLTDPKEHVVSFGISETGDTIISAIATGAVNHGYVPEISKRFADIHIHTGNLPPSSGDLYNFIDEARTAPHYIRYVAASGGAIYALVLVHQENARQFSSRHKKRPGIKVANPDGTVSRYQPTFPPYLVDELNKLRDWDGATPEMAFALLLQKYDAGVALLRCDTNGRFRRLITLEKTGRAGAGRYTYHLCP